MTMQIIRWNPMREVAHMHDEVMREWLAATRAGRRTNWVPLVDVIEGDGSITLQMDLPGVALEDVTVEYAQGLLHVSGERRRAELGGTWQRMERPMGRFARQVRLPDDIAAERISASLDRGVLTIEIPRAERAAPLRIAITPALEQADE